MKNIFAILASANSGISLTTTALLVLILPYISLSQIKIEERVEILPGGVNNVLLDGSISGDSRNPAYIAYGGSVRVRAINASSFGTYELWEETYGRIPNVLTTVNLGIYPQWHKFVFYLLNPITQQKYYPEPGDLIVWDFPSTIDFYPSRQPGDPYPPNPEHWWEIRIVVDYSLAAMPPPEILNYFGNPFAQSQPLEVPLDGSLYAVIYPYTNANDELWMDLPGTQLIQDDIKNHYGETFELGDMTAGDEIRFFLNSSNTIVSGSNLYPLCEVVEDPTPTGDILLWRLYFEDWTDLLFDDVKIEIYIRPEGDYPGNIAAIVEPEELAPGDTASITFKKRYLNGTLEDFPEWKTFEVGMVEGCTLGNLLVDGELEPYFYDVAQPVYFVADSSADTGTVKLQVALVEEIIGLKPVQNNFTNETDKQIKTENPKQKGNLKEIISAKRENRTEPVDENKKIFENVTPNNPENLTCPFLNFNNLILSPFEIPIKDEVIEILLGETKYFQAKYKDPLSNKLTIEEVIPGPNGVPQLNGGLTSDVWENNPVSVDTGNNYGKKMGVYWEKEKPMVNGQNLPTGLIRLVGRYWHQDSTYIVNLKAKTSNGDSTSIKIKVIKPSELKSDNQSDSYSTTRDVFNAIIKIDSLCTHFGGINGIPPQFIKGHIYSESAHTNFGGEVGMGFAPSYRYEPYTTQNKKAVLEDMKSNPFYITATTNVNPPNHQYVKTIPYFSGDTITVWQIVAEHSQLVTDGSTEETRMYGVRTTKDTMNYGNYTTMQKKYHSFFKKTEDATKFDIILNKNRKLTFAERADSTNRRMIVYLRDEFPFVDLNNTKGMKNMIAQTRIASSYGYFQPLYTTAINKKDNWLYPENAENPPENLNKNDIVFPMATRMHREYLEKGLKNQSNNNWTLGFEASLKRYILKVWNTDKNYPNSVFSNVNRFLPQK